MAHCSPLFASLHRSSIRDLINAKRQLLSCYPVRWCTQPCLSTCTQSNCATLRRSTVHANQHECNVLHCRISLQHTLNTALMREHLTHTHACVLDSLSLQTHALVLTAHTAPPKHRCCCWCCSFCCHCCCCYCCCCCTYTHALVGQCIHCCCPNSCTGVGLRILLHNHTSPVTPAAVVAAAAIAAAAAGCAWAMELCLLLTPSQLNN